MEEGHENADLEHVQELFVEGLTCDGLKVKTLVVKNLELVLPDQERNRHTVVELLDVLFGVPAPSKRLVRVNAVNAAQAEQHLLDLSDLGHVSVESRRKVVRVGRFHSNVLKQRYR